MTETKTEHVPYQRSMIFYIVLAAPVGGIVSKVIDYIVSTEDIRIVLHRIAWFSLGVLVTKLYSYQKDKWEAEHEQCNQDSSTCDANQAATPAASI